MRTAIYARYSSDLQRNASIEDQVRTCRARIDAEGWVLAGVYSDHATSGASNLRPGYQKLLEDARSGAIDVVLAEALDRLSRDLEATASLYKQLTFAGVRLITLAEGEVSDLHVGLKGTMNQMYLKDLAQKTRRGLEGRVRQGRSGGGLSYGYDVARKAAANGDAETGLRTINEAEAAIVRRIFAEYATGHSPRAIAQALNRDGLTGPRGTAWSPSTIHGNRQRGTGILNNELYVGRLVWNRLRYVKDPATGKRISRLNPESAHIAEQVPELRIIDQELWEQVKTRQGGLEARKQPAPGDPGFWDKRRPRYLLSKLVKCGTCGGGYSMISAHLMGCSNARNRGTCDDRLNIRRDVLEATILDGLRTRLMHPALVEEFARAYIDEVNRMTHDRNAVRKQTETELGHVNRRVRTLVDLLAEGGPKALLAELERLEARQTELEGKLAEPASAPQPLLHPNLAALYRGKVEQLTTLLDEPTARDEAFQSIRSLIDEVTLVPVDGELRVDLHGQLAAILALCQNSKKPGTISRDGLAQLVLVAGVGFEPTTFRL